jgi:4-hydroxy-tetrahydrodipicolinate reductase
MSPLRLLINGSRGRMGQAIIAAAKADPAVAVAATVDQGDDFSSAIALADVVIDFSHHDVTVDVAHACVANNKILVVGTTGHTDAEVAAITEAAKSIPIVFASNYSVGVNTLFWLTRKAAEILGPDFDLEVMEMHHRLKKDSPSGTAKRLAEILAEVRELQG